VQEADPEANREAAAPNGRGRLGASFAKLWLAQGVSNLGDGVYLTTLPLLAATLTRDPFAVSAVMFAEWLPWLLFGLMAGALLDRWDRRRVMWTVDAARLVAVGGLAAAVLAGWASIPLLMLTGFLLGTGQTLVDTGSQALIPALVSRDPQRLQRANGRLLGTQVITQQLAGPPAGGFLFSVATWIPFAVDAVSFGVSSALVAAIPGHGARGSGSGSGEASPPGRRTSLRAEIAEGLRWLFAHRVLRAMAVLVAGVNIALTGSDAIMVLFAQERLGLGSVGFGLLLTGSAVGGAAGSVVAPRLSRRLGPVPVMTGGFIVAGVAAVGIGLTRSPWVAGSLLTLSGLVVVTFNVIMGSLRQQLIPDRLLGRVISAFRLFSYGSVPLGALFGGAVASRFGLPAPFFVVGVALPVMAMLALPFVNRHTVAHALAAVEEGTVSPATDTSEE
jgi:MFS family permease